MGLSNEERYSKMVYAIRAITRIGKTLPPGSLKTLTEALWPALLRKNRNAAFWILGGDTDKDHVQSNSLFGLALLHHKPHRDEWKKPEEPYQVFAKDRLSLLNLLEERKDPIAKVLEIFKWTELATYGLRRYPDEMAEGLRDLDDTLCQIQGECLQEFLQAPILLRAWLQSQIIDRILTWQDDIVSTWWKKQNLHHDLRLIEAPYGPTTERLLEIFKKIQFEDPSINDRVLITIELAGPRWHYAHQHREALALFEKHNRRAKKADKIDIAAVRTAAELCEKTHKDREERNRRNYAERIYCELTEQGRPTPKKKPATKPKPKAKKG